MKLQATLAVLALLSLALAGCTGSGDGDDCVTPPKEGNLYIIKMLPSNKFSPPCAEIPAGSTIVWINEGGSHNLVPDGHDLWEATDINGDTGEHFRIIINQPGEYDYFCQPHKALGMVGTLKIV